MKGTLNYSKSITNDAKGSLQEHKDWYGNKIVAVIIIENYYQKSFIVIS